MCTTCTRVQDPWRRAEGAELGTAEEWAAHPRRACELRLSGRAARLCHRLEGSAVKARPEDAAELDAIAVEAEERLGGKHFVTQFARRLLLARDAEARLLAAGPGAMAALGADLVARAASCEAYLVECQDWDVAGR